MGAKSKELEDLEKNIEGLKMRLSETKSHLGSIELMRYIEELEKKKEKLEKSGSNWISD